MFAAGVTMGLAERIIDDTYLVIICFTAYLTHGCPDVLNYNEFFFRLVCKYGKTWLRESGP